MSNYVSEVVCIHYKTDNYFNINIHIAIKSGACQKRKKLFKRVYDIEIHYCE